MNKKFKQFSISLLFCLIFIMCFSSFIPVFAKDEKAEFDESGETLNGGKTPFSSLEASLKTSTYQSFMKMAEDGYVNTSIIPEFKLDGNVMDFSQNNGADWVDGILDEKEESKSEKVELTFTLKDKDGNETNYIYTTYYKQYDCGKTDKCTNRVNMGTPTQPVYECGGHAKSGGSDKQKKEWGKAEQCGVFMEKMYGAVIDGVTAGAISAGYNIGTAYSRNQKALADVMQYKDDGYDFKMHQGVEYTMSSFYSPVYGEKLLEDILTNFATEDKWAELTKNYISGTSVKIDSGFLTMYSELDPTGAKPNANGDRISSTVTFTNGVKAYSKVGGTTTPKSILSYNMNLAVPYLFELSGTLKGSLITSDLHIIDGYKYNIYNERIYDSSGNEVTTMPNVDIGRNQLYLYNQEITDPATQTTSLIGVVIVAYFDEVIVDTTVDVNNNTNNEPILYLTGRRIGFTNGYSDKLDFKDRNVNLMYVTGEAGKTGYLAKCVSFPVDATALKSYSLRDALSGRVQNMDQDLVNAIAEITQVPTSQEMLDFVIEKDNHAKLPEYPRVVKMFIDFGFISVNSDTVVNNKGIQISQTANTNTEEGKYAFYIVRNNMYYEIEGNDLVDWLSTDLARSMTYVDADALLAKIKGDFTNKLGKITYEEYMRMQEIRRELQYDKDMWLVRTFNVASLVMGCFLIVFAILLVLFYWFDQFNAFTSFSLVQFVSMGNLYPVWDKDIVPYVPMNSDKVKFVTFKDILIIAFILVVMGILFVNVGTIVEFIINVYNYIMFIFGGAK